MNPYSSLDRPPLRANRLRPMLAGPGGPAQRFELVESCESTNTELIRLARQQPAEWPDLSVLTTDVQHAGRGRLERDWVSPPRAGVAVSILVRPSLPMASWPQLSLVAALAVVRALGDVTELPVGVKWPNDVVLEDFADIPGWGQLRKVGGILVEAAGAPGAVVVGIGINVTETDAELPVPWATSLVQAGATVSRHTVLCAVVRRFATAYRQWCAGGFEELRGQVQQVCRSLGQQIRVELPGGRIVTGLGRNLGENGELVLETDDGLTCEITAGDAIHVRDGHHR